MEQLYQTLCTSANRIVWMVIISHNVFFFDNIGFISSKKPKYKTCKVNTFCAKHNFMSFFGSCYSNEFVLKKVANREIILFEFLLIQNVTFYKLF